MAGFTPGDVIRVSIGDDDPDGSLPESTHEIDADVVGDRKRSADARDGGDRRTAEDP